MLSQLGKIRIQDNFLKNFQVFLGRCLEYSFSSSSKNWHKIEYLWTLHNQIQLGKILLKMQHKFV